MTEAISSPPVVLCASGHDPSGGAGLQADIEAIRALGAHPAVAITCLTVQDTRNVFEVEAVADDWFDAVLDRLCNDLPIRAIKVGVVGSPGQCRRIAELYDRLNEQSPCPLVLDPVLVASGGGRLADDPTAAALLEHLLPRATLLTPNLAEARRLSGEQDADACAATLLAQGAQWVLITGGDTQAAQVSDRLYGGNCDPVTLSHPRLAQSCHGSGCSLASACAALLAHEPEDIPRVIAEVVAEAVAQVQHWLESGYRPGQGQYVPLRLPPE